MVVLLVAATCYANTEDTLIIGGLDGLDIADTRESYSISLALSGGGARGLSVVGILRAFEEKSIKVCAVAGTSMGGIIGGLYASGYGPDELASIASELSFGELFSNSPSRTSMLLTRRQDRDRHLLSVRFDGLRPVVPQALTAGQKLTSLLTSLTARANYRCRSDFSSLTIPFKTISTDIVSGHEVVLDTGSIADAMRATMAFPLAFTGLETETQVLMDGGMVTPIPVRLVRTMCDSANFVVAVNTASKLLPKEELITPLDIANQVTSIMTADQLDQQLSSADYVIDPPLGDLASSDFKYKDSIIEIGYNCGLIAADSIITMIKQRKGAGDFLITSVEVSPIGSGKEETIRARLDRRRMTQRDLRTELRELCRTLGLFRLHARLEYTDVSAPPVSEVALHVDAVENFKFEDTWLNFAGNTIFDNSTLARELLEADSVITSASLRQGLKNIIALYEDLGYDLANVRKVEIDTNEKMIVIEIDEAIIRRVDVENNTHTADWYIRSYFTLEAGQIYSTSTADDGIANIYGTDLFDRVTATVTPSDEGALVKLGVEEKESRQLRFGWHWDDEYRSEEFVEFVDDNVGGIGLQYLAHARYAPRRQHYYTQFKADRILSTYLTSRFNIYHHRINRAVFADDIEIDTRKERKTGLDIVMGQQLARLGHASVTFSAQYVEYENLNAGTDRQFDLRIVKFESVLENFDRLPFPTRGNRHLMQLQLAGKFIGGDEEFTRFYASFETYFPLNRYVTYHPRLEVGISRSGLPPSEQFFLGGLHSFAGFRTHQLAGDKMFIFSNEIRVKLPFKLYLSGRHDMGEVYVSSDQIKLRNLRHGVGISLALDSPIGPFELGYGIVNTDLDRFYVNVGFEF